jgi:hypothetical protein
VGFFCRDDQDRKAEPLLDRRHDGVADDRRDEAPMPEAPVIIAAPRLWRSTRGLEWLLAAAILLAVGYATWFFRTQGYLPQPFLYDLNAPLVGLYETAYWANNPDTYGVGQNIYPPLSFVIMKIFSIHRCYVAGVIAGRSCDWLARDILLGFYVLNIPLVHQAYRNTDPSTAFPRTLAVCLGLPMLYALECGNVIIMAFTFFVLGSGGFTRSSWPRWLSLAVSINFKPYLLVVFLPALIRQRWRWILGCGLAGGAVYLATFAILGVGSPAEILRNLSLYATYVAQRHWSDIYYATSYLPLTRFMISDFSLLGFPSAQSGAGWVTAFTILMRLAQFGVATCLLAALWRPSAVNARRSTAMILAVILTTMTTGQSGYVQIFLFFLVFFEPWRGPTRIVILMATYVLCIPADFALLPVIHGVTESYLGGRRVTASFGVSIGQLVRPAVLLVVQFGLIALNAGDLLAAGHAVEPTPVPDTVDEDFIPRVAGASPRR